MRPCFRIAAAAHAQHGKGSTPRSRTLVRSWLSEKNSTPRSRTLSSSSSRASILVDEQTSLDAAAAALLSRACVLFGLDHEQIHSTLSRIILRILEEGGTSLSATELWIQEAYRNLVQETIVAPLNRRLFFESDRAIDDFLLKADAGARTSTGGNTGGNSAGDGGTSTDRGGDGGGGTSSPWSQLSFRSLPGPASFSHASFLALGHLGPATADLLRVHSGSIGCSFAHFLDDVRAFWEYRVRSWDKVKRVPWGGSMTHGKGGWEGRREGGREEGRTRTRRGGAGFHESWRASMGLF